MKGLHRGLTLGLLLGLTGCSTIGRRPDPIPTTLVRPVASPVETKDPVDPFAPAPDPGLARYFPHLAGRVPSTPPASTAPSPTPGAAPRTTPSGPEVTATETRHP